VAAEGVEEIDQVSDLPAVVRVAADLEVLPPDKAVGAEELNVEAFLIHAAMLV
jgi:hypothetical protein